MEVCKEEIEYKAGDNVLALWGGVWFSAELKFIKKNGLYGIHYKGFNSAYDRVVSQDNIRPFDEEFYQKTQEIGNEVGSKESRNVSSEGEKAKSNIDNSNLNEKVSTESDLLTSDSEKDSRGSENNAINRVDDKATVKFENPPDSPAQETHPNENQGPNQEGKHMQFKQSSLSLEVRSQTTAVEKLSVGSRVEVFWEGDNVWYSGAIRRVNRNGSCAVDYDDGEFEPIVARRLIRVSSKDQNTNEKKIKPEPLNDGERMTANREKEQKRKADQDAKVFNRANSSKEGELNKKSDTCHKGGEAMNKQLVKVKPKQRRPPEHQPKITAERRKVRGRPKLKAVNSVPETESNALRKQISEKEETLELKSKPKPSEVESLQAENKKSLKIIPPRIKNQASSQEEQIQKVTKQRGRPKGRPKGQAKPAEDTQNNGGRGRRTRHQNLDSPQRRSKRLRAPASSEPRRRHCRTPPPRLQASNSPSSMVEGVETNRRFSWELAEERALKAAIQRSLEAETSLIFQKQKKCREQAEDSREDLLQQLPKRQKKSGETGLLGNTGNEQTVGHDSAKKRLELKERGSNKNGCKEHKHPKSSKEKPSKKIKRKEWEGDPAPSHWVRRSQREPGIDQQASPRFQELLQLLEENSPDTTVLKLKDYFGSDANPSTINAVLHVLERNTSCQVLYFQNFNKGMLAPQLLHLMKVLQQGHIWSVNLGENWQIPEIIWDKFAEGLKESNVTHLYVSESAISPELKIKMRDIIRNNRKKHDRHKSIDNLHVIERFVSIGGCISQAH